MAENKAHTRILLLTGVYKPDIGGPATYSAFLEEYLPKEEYHITVLPFSRVRLFPKVLRHFVYLFYALVKGYSHDLIYALDATSTGFPGALASNLLDKPFLVRIGGDYAWEMASLKHNETLSPIEYVEKKKVPYSIRLLRSIQKFVLREASRVIVPSEYLKKVFIEQNISSDEIVVIYNAAKSEIPLAQKDVLRKLMNLNGTIAVSAGRLIPLKGFDALIDVAKEIREKISDFKLIIIGTGSEEKNLKKKVKEMHLEETVLFTGALATEVLHPYIKAADVFVLNAQHETFSNLLLEVAAIGTPIVTTNVGGNPEFLEDGKQAKLVTYGDNVALRRALTEVIEDESVGDILEANAKAKLKHFSPQEKIQEFIDVVESIYE